MSTLHDIAIRDYSEHYARMNPTLDAAKLPQRTYRNMQLMYGPLVGGLAPGQAVADLGCGAGFMLRWLARRSDLRIVGVDASEGQVEYSRKAAPSVEVVFQDALSFLRNHPNEFGGLFCVDMLEHLETDHDVFAFLLAAKAALQPGGFLVCRVPNAAHVLGSYGRYMDITHHRSFTSHSLRQALSAAGFKNIELIRTRSSSWLGQLRLYLEHVLHTALFVLGGYLTERTFTQNVIAVGFQKR